MKRTMRRSLCLVLCLLMVAGLLPLSALAAAPTVVEEFNFSATTIEAPGSVNITMKLTDAYSSAMYVWIEFYCEENDTYIGADLIGYDFDPMIGSFPYADGKLRGGMTLNWNVEAGTYKLSAMGLMDEEGEYYTFATEPELYENAMPLPKEVESVQLVIVNNNPADIDPPVLKNVTLSATKVTAPGELEVIVEAPDAVSGAYYGSVTFWCEEVEEYLHAELDSEYWDAGKGAFVKYADGKLHGVVELPWNASIGTYVLHSVDLRDVADNWVDYFVGDNEWSEPMPDKLRSVQFTITSTKTDYNDPVLKGLTLSASSVTIPGEVEVIVDATDDLSGVNYAEVGFYCAEKESGLYTMLSADYYDQEMQKRVPYADGKLHGTLRLESHMEPGTYWLQYIYIEDEAWNGVVYEEEESEYSELLPTELKSIKLVVNAAKNGWVSAGNKWYYYKNGVKLTSQWLEDAGKWYYLDADGVMKTGWVSVGGKWYYMDANGIMQTGWLKLDGKWYYLNTSGVMVTGTVTIEGKQHKFNGSGVWQGEVTKSGWVSEGGKWYYYKNGSKVTGWLQDGGKWYYFNASGVMQTGWLKSGSTWYYLQSSGAMATGWVSVGGKWYYMNTSGAMVTGWVKVGSTWYYMNGSGVMHTGWLKLDGKWYYMNSSGAMVTGTVKIDGKTYKFNSSGVWLG